MFAVARVAWMFKFFGATDVSIMRGGMQKWVKEGRPTFSGLYRRGTGLKRYGDFDGYKVNDPTLLVDDVTKMHDIAAKLHNGCQVSQIVDSRIPSAFGSGGTQLSEELRGGNIPGSLNVPFD